MNRITFFFLFLISLNFIACEEVVNIPLQSSEPRLVVDATIDWKKGTEGNLQTIKLSNSTGYYDSVIPKVSGATVYITNSNNSVFDFIESNNIPGNYICQNFIPIINETYTLTIIHQGQIYKATEILAKAPTIKRVEQKNDGGFMGQDIEIKFFFNDIPNESNFYFASIKNPHVTLPEYAVLEDRFFQNNEMSIFYSNSNLISGDILLSSIGGISKNYFNFMNILIAQTGNNSGGPFSTPPTTIRGNIVNQTNFENYALGYFRLSESDFMEYVVK